MIISAPKFLRVEDFADSAVMIKILGDTKPLKQWEVAGELRMRLKIAFDNNGIEIPFPQRVVHQGK
jgi:small conductance mechanosensitive channel